MVQYGYFYNVFVIRSEQRTATMCGLSKIYALL